MQRLAVEAIARALPRLLHSHRKKEKLMKEFLSTLAGKVSAAFIVSAAVLSALAFLWRIFSKSEQHDDLAIGILRGSIILALIGLIVALQSRTEARNRKRRESQQE
jgi:uncharacterized membrane protein YkvI